MKRTLLLTLCIISLLSVPGCEKDDICPPNTAVTPMLIIRFYDVADPDNVLRVPTLKVTGEGQADAVINRITTDSIAIPLRSFETTTTFSMIKESASDATTGAELGNEDIISFNYETREIFISRGCGYIANYLGLVNQLQGDTDNWIKQVSVEIEDVTNQKQAHVKIYH